MDSAGYIFYAVVDRDLTTGRDSIRRDVAQMGHVSATATLWGSPDHSKVLVLSPGSPSCGYVYDAATDSFSPCSSLSFNPAAPATATTNGDKWLVGSQLVDGSLNVIAPVGSSGLYLTGRSRMSGALLERVRVPGLAATPERITVFPEGNRLFLWSQANGASGFVTTQATVVDLTH